MAGGFILYMDEPPHTVALAPVRAPCLRIVECLSADWPRMEIGTKASCKRVQCVILTNGGSASLVVSNGGCVDIR